MEAISSSTIEQRLQSAHQEDHPQDGCQHPAVLLPSEYFPHNVCYDTLQTLPLYIVDLDVTPHLDGVFDRYSYWGWTAAAVETIEEELSKEHDFPTRMYSDNWTGEDAYRDLETPGAVMSKFDPLQTLLRFAMLYGRLERSIKDGEIPIKAALLGDLPRVIEYMSFSLLEGMASTAIGEHQRASWSERITLFSNELSEGTQDMIETIDDLSTPTDYLPSYGKSIAKKHKSVVSRDDIQYSSFLEFLKEARNSAYHDSREANVGTYVTTLICAIVWDQLSASQYKIVREKVLNRLNDDINNLESNYDPDSGFEDFCLCSGGKRYLEFYPFSSAELATESFNNDI